MRYSGRANWGLALPLLIPIILGFFKEDPIAYVSFSFAIGSLFILLIAKMQNSVTIEESKLTYDSHLFRWHILHIEIAASNIRSKKFHLSGWLGRKAIVKGKQATFGYHFINYKPMEFYDELEQFAIRNNIQYEKTKDYKAIENTMPRS